MRMVQYLAVTCAGCGLQAEVPPWRMQGKARYFCGKACYLKDHATTPRQCAACGKSFVSRNYSATQKYCSLECRPMHGSDNPNFGKRHPGAWQMPSSQRLLLSDTRRGEGNPRWTGGSPGNGKFQHQGYVRAWALAELPDACAECGSAERVDLYHVAPMRYFRPRRLAHFVANLLPLCPLHHRRSAMAAHRAMKAGKPADLPFADRLPQSILAALERDGSVSSPLAGCDYSPLGNLVEQVVPQTLSGKQR